MAVEEKGAMEVEGTVEAEAGVMAAEEMVEEVEVREKIRVNGSHVVRVLRRREKVIDDDLPLIAEAYREFRNETPEPGA